MEIIKRAVIMKHGVLNKQVVLAKANLAPRSTLGAATRRT